MLNLFGISLDVFKVAGGGSQLPVLSNVVIAPEYVRRLGNLPDISFARFGIGLPCALRSIVANALSSRFQTGPSGGAFLFESCSDRVRAEDFDAKTDGIRGQW